MGYNPCLADTDLWMRPMERSSNILKHYENFILYIGDFLSIGDNRIELLQKNDKYFGLNICSLANLSIYIGAKL